ncbi:branched-chain amino acid ABC transporter permease [Pseudaminobacter soli (ex Li et al. 2025)]|uniref:Branched-chain amino acid ABC transporter permease n=1 Tax=Pseudaminobacter soli (ex Li et al. 2025) TaxID=1295366 RepID=A0A2P7SEP4_9HYPH|nr:branched-chain amino acid ABC transporter permease [Mesorhizobium soli]PSJ60982.1 branched-chain amino acid ABC transporter permease [Mesorhizobium soli]
MLYFFQQFLNGLHIGAIYALLAFGYVLINGVLHRTNLAHGAIFAFSGQTMILIAVFGWQVLWMTLPMTLAVAITATFGYAALTGIVLSRNVFEPLAKSSPNAIVVATLGVLLFLTELARISAQTHDFWLPPMLATPVVFAEGDGYKVTLTVMQLLNCALIVAALAASGLAVARTRFGRDLRAVSDDPAAAAMCGIDTSLVFRGAVLLGTLCAALAGILAALYFGNIGFGSGLVFGLKILFVTAVGSYRSPIQAAAGAACFGIAESLWSGYFPIEWREGWIFLFLVVMLVLRFGGQETQQSYRQSL